SEGGVSGTAGIGAGTGNVSVRIEGEIQENPPVTGYLHSVDSNRKSQLIEKHPYLCYYCY
ncbi:MAG: hypothetical protein PHQ23_15140, partial [Candidatus Wallbacteria bacterium]|nr:hypothetical protein [Candidatus Wallbacteria bacterium]